MDGGIDGASHRLTTDFSASLDSNGVTEIGLYSTSESCLGCGQPHNAHPTAKINRVKDLVLIF